MDTLQKVNHDFVLEELKDVHRHLIMDSNLMLLGSRSVYTKKLELCLKVLQDEPLEDSTE